MLRSPLAALLACCALAPPAAAQAPAAVTTFGNAPGTLRLPEAVAVAPDGTVLVGDHFSGRIQRFAGGRPAPGAFGFSGEVCGRLGAVSGIARAADGRVYVFDSDNHRVHVFTAAGAIERCFGRMGTGRGELRGGSGAYAASSARGGIAVSGRHVYVADTGNDRVQRFTLDGREPKVLGRGLLSHPQGLAVRGRRLLVADDQGHRVVELTTSGRFVRASRAQVRFPYDVALAPDGKAYVADNNGHRVVVLDRRLRAIRAWGRFGHGPGRFVYPRAIALAPNGNVLVADAGNDRVTEFTARGRYVRTLGANGRARGSVTAPADVAVNDRGEVAVADANARVSWFGLGGRWLGAWAQGRSFQQSTAVVLSPRSLAFAAADRLRVVDGSTILRFGAGEAGALLDQARPGAIDGVRARAVAVDPARGTTWMLTGTGRIAPVAADGRLGAEAGDEDPRDRASTDLAVLADGSVAVTEGAAEHRPRPQDGIVRRYDASGRRVATWAIPRPLGGEASKPAGVASDGAGGAWVSDAANGRVLRLAPSGAIVQTLGEPGAEPGQLAEPAGLTIACDGALLVADRGNNRVARFAGVAPAAGCAAVPSPPTAALVLPRAAGLRVRVRSRPAQPARRLAVLRATCRRTCRLEVTAQAHLLDRGRFRDLPVTARLSGRTITVTAGDATVRRLRRAVRAGSRAGVAVTVRATTPDGIVDGAGSVLTFRR